MLFSSVNNKNEHSTILEAGYKRSEEFQ